MSERKRFRGVVTALGAVGVLGVAGQACLDRPVAKPNTLLQSGVSLDVVNNAVDSVDILFEVDNSNSMRDNQSNLARQFDVLISQLVSPPDRDMDGRPDYPPVKSLHVGVVSSDLGTPGSVVPSCVNSDVGDDGLLNPIRNGQSMRGHQPWTTARAGDRPARCTMDPNQYPSFLEFDAATSNAADFREDFVCNAFLSVGGCGLEQQLESVYRALVVHNPRAQPGNMDPNAGFVRDNAVLAIVIVSDEEDGSTRDCRYAEGGMPCTDALGVFDSTSGAWAAADLNLRFYMYQTGSPQDPTWPLDRYIDPAHPNRGFTSLKLNKPSQVIFATIAGVPLQLPMVAGANPPQVDWATLLDTNGGIATMSNEGPISMRQANMDPQCSTRVVPACRREGTSYDPMRPACDTTQQYFAWPSRRIVEVARRFDTTYHGNGAVSSICANDYSPALQTIVQRIQRQLSGRCLSRALVTNASPPCCTGTPTPGCTTGSLCGTAEAIAVRCTVKEYLPSSVDASSWCNAGHGRRMGDMENGQHVCLVDQVAVQLGMNPPAGAHGFYYDTSIDPSAPSCMQRISFTTGDSIPNGATAKIECVQTGAIGDSTDAGTHTAADSGTHTATDAH